MRRLGASRRQGAGRHQARLRWAAGGAVLGLGFAAGPVLGETIRFEDGTEVHGTIVRKDGERVLIQVPRANVVSVDGAPLPAPVTTGAIAPDFAATDLAGATQRLADGSGRPTLLQFWASWCPHCRADLALMKDLSSTYAGSGLRILTVSIDRDPDQLTAFMRQEQLPYPVISANASLDIPGRYETDGVPAYFLIDGQGRIAWVLRGSVTETKSDLKEQIARLLSSGA